MEATQCFYKSRIYSLIIEILSTTIGNMIPVILSGGSGTRLWPVSRESYPKQFCEFFDKSFLRSSIERVREVGDPWVVTLSSMAELTKRALAESGFDANSIVLEPMAKNTAPAIALMCHVLQMKGLEKEIVGIFPADHYMSQPQVLIEALKLAQKEAANKKVVTLGISPYYAATGYGYIELETKPKTKQALSSYSVRAFVEKPKKEAAEKMIQEKRFFWNAGLFVFRVDHMIELFKAHLPQVWSKITEVKPDFTNAAYVYANIQPISLDYGILEKAKDLVCIPCDLGWSDVGSWDEVARLSEEVPTDSQAQVFLSEAENNFVYSTRAKVVGLAHVNDIIVIDTPDALLVTRKGESQQVKGLVEKMRHEKVIETSEHSFVMANWGKIETIDENVDFKIVKLTIDANSEAMLAPARYMVLKGEVDINQKKYGTSSHIALDSATLAVNRSALKAVLIEVTLKRG